MGQDKYNFAITSVSSSDPLIYNQGPLRQGRVGILGARRFQIMRGQPGMQPQGNATLAYIEKFYELKSLSFLTYFLDRDITGTQSPKALLPSFPNTI